MLLDSNYRSSTFGCCDYCCCIKWFDRVDVNDRDGELRLELFCCRKRIKEERALYDAVVRNAILLCERSLQDEDAVVAEVFVDGASNIFGKPEFSDTETIRQLFQTFEEKSRLVKILNECVAGDSTAVVQVLIGRENPASSMQHCSVITTSYRVGTDVCGTLGVVGPTRIAYGRMMAVVNYLGRFMERAFVNDASLQ